MPRSIRLLGARIAEQVVVTVMAFVSVGYVRKFMAAWSRVFISLWSTSMEGRVAPNGGELRGDRERRDYERILQKD